MRFPAVLSLLLLVSCAGPEANPKSTDAWERYLGVREELAPRRDAEAMGELVSLLDDPHPLVVVGVLETFEEIGDPAFLQHAGTGLKHSSPLVREYACRLTASLRAPEGVKLLSATLAKDADAGVRRAAVKGLKRYGKDALVLEPLAAAVGDADPSVSTAAHEALVELTGRVEVGRRAEEWRKAVAK